MIRRLSVHYTYNGDDYGSERVTIIGFRNVGSFDGQFLSNYALEPSQAASDELAAGIYRFDNRDTGTPSEYNVFAMGKWEISLRF